MGVNYGVRVITDGLILYYDAANKRSYPGSGSSWYDISGSNNTGTLINSPTYSTIKQGGLQFISASSQYVTTSISFVGDFTIEVAINPATVTVKQSLVSNYDGNGVGFEIIAASLWNFFVFTTGGVGSVQSPATVIVSTDYIVTCVKSGTTINLYQNGVLIQTGTLPASTIQGSNLINIAKDQIQTWYANATIYSVKIYNRGLSATEVLQNFNAYRGRYGI